MPERRELTGVLVRKIYHKSSVAKSTDVLSDQVSGSLVKLRNFLLQLS